MSKNVKRLLSIVSMILCITLVSSIPVQAVSQTIDKDKEGTIYSSFDNVKGGTEEIGNIIAENTSARTENTKEFMLDDGTTMLAEYNQPVHYKNDKGKWVEYNNSLISENTASTADEAGEAECSNKSSNIDIKLSNKAKANNMIKVTSDDYSISWGYNGANKSKINIVNNNEKLSGNDKFTTLKNITSEAKYENVYKNVDLQCFITSTGIKENIILKNADVQNEFNITYKIKNLTAKQTDDYTITLYNKENKAVYTIVAPYMTDANGESSNQLKLDLVKQKGSNLNVKLTADYWFIHSIGRSFPITIDPELTNKLTKQLSLYENTNNSIKSYGPYYNSNNSYLICAMNSLPQLEDGEKIISAKFNFETTNGSSLFTNESDSPIIVNAHRLNYASNGVSKYDSDILDYDSLTYNDNKYVSFELTKLMNEWYDNGSSVDGFVLESFDTIGSKTVAFKSATKTSTTPSLTLIYKDFTGTESNLTYHTVNAGHNAQVSVGDYLGNLVINQSLIEETGTRMPLSITAAYNSINYNTIFGNGSPSGYGWQFSFNQYVREITDKNLSKNGYNYIYTDSNGTDHYLKKSADKEEWCDEDSLGITLTKNDSNIIIDNGSTTQTYELTSNGGKLLSEKDEYNNTITYTYTDGNVTSITDGSGRVTNLTYYTNSNGDKRVSRITRPDGKSVIFSYTSDEYDKIHYLYLTDDKVSRFFYDSSNRLTTIEHGYFDNGNYKKQDTIKFTYSGKGQVTKIAEYGSDNTEGNYLNINYGNDNTTVFTDRQNRSVTYTFDNSGNKVSVLNANGYLESGDSNGLTISSGADSFTKNYITESTEQSAVGSGNYYYKTNGARNGVTSSGGTVTIDSSEPTEENGHVQYFGTTSIKVNHPVSESNSAFFTGATHQIDSTEFNGKDITFSAYVKTKDVKQIYSGGPIGATLKIKCYDSSGTTLKDINSIGISGTQDWQRLSVSVKVPENTSRIRVYCNLRYTSGTAWFDCLQLEEGNCANDFNALQNGNFESNEYWLTNENKAITAQNGTVTINGEAGTYDNAEDYETVTEPAIENVEPSTYVETVTETEPNDSITTYDDYGNEIKTEQGFVTRTVKKTYEVEATTESLPEDTDHSDESGDNGTSTGTESSDNALGNKYIYQNVKVGRAGVMFNITGEAQAKSVALSNENRTYGIALNIYYEGSSVPETHYQEFNATTSQKQTTCMAVTPKNATTKISYVSFAFVYGNNKNTMTVYNAMLNISPAYASDNTTDDSQNEDEVVDYEVISESVDKTKPFMQTSSAYDNTGNYLASKTDEAGNTVTYTYDANGNTTSVTDGEGNVVNYTYNSSNDVTSVKSNGAENKYSYNGVNSVSAITHNGFSYNFNYDVFNNLISTKIGDVAIASNTYSANNGNLTKTTYANGDFVEYTYDRYDNITKITGENGTIAEFIYNKKGLVAKAVDNSSATTTYYYYDFGGNLTGEYRQTSGGDLSYFLSYDADGNKVEKTSINGQTKTITTGTDSDGKSFVSNDGVTAKTETDDFGRTTQVKTSRGEGNSVFFTNYEYASGKSENSTTNLVRKLTQKYGSDELVNYEYTYDKNGNITEIYENGTLAHKYTYDSLNQLYSEYDYINLFYISYSYDGKGNILAKHEQALHPTYLYPTGKDSGNVYYYNDTEWKDKLTKINQYNITYDESGNPLIYRDGMTFTWQNGRQLASLQTEDNSVTYKYDSNGMRTQKTDNSGTTYYYYDNDKNLIGLTKGSSTLLFYYDSDGNVTSLKYNGIMLYYVKNLQGDVVKIISQDGVGYVSYVYDAWGNVKSASGEPILRELNPFRYRSYVYDNESGLYYLQSRYYDPFTGRFLNADDTAFLGATGTALSANLFTYCENNPVNNMDYNGNEFISLSVLGIYMVVSLVVGLTAIAVVNTPGFKRGWSDLCNKIGTGLSNALNGLGNAVKWIASKAKEIANDIYKSFSKVKSKPKYKSNTELHHIVAKGATKAKEAQKALKNVGIKYKTDNRNLIRIKTGLHRRLHTNKYYAFVNELVVDAYNKGKSYNQRKNNVEKVLKNLKNMISSMNKLAPF